jgi:hypothetical protein
LAWVLDDTPLVISIDDLVENFAFKFYMMKVRKETVALLMKGSKKIKLPVIQGVPVLKA